MQPDDHHMHPATKENTSAKRLVAFEITDFTVLEIHCQRLIVDKEFSALAQRLWLTAEDMRRIADAVCGSLKTMGWFVPPLGLVLTVDKSPNPQGFPFWFSLTECDQSDLAAITGMIGADSTIVQQSISDCGTFCSRLEKQGKPLSPQTVLHSTFAMKLAHELTHAFGLHRRSEQFGKWPISDLELLTDACAFLSCEKFIGETAFLGSSYLHKALKPGMPLAAEAMRDLAASVVASAKQRLPLPNQ